MGLFVSFKLINNKILQQIKPAGKSLAHTHICICNLTIYMKKNCPRLLFCNREISGNDQCQNFSKTDFRKIIKSMAFFGLTMQHSISFQQSRTSVLLNKVLILWLKHLHIICLKLATKEITCYPYF